MFSAFGPFLRRLRQLRPAWLALGLLVIGAAPAAALVSFDFETPYLVHPGRQVWDFCLIRDAGQYHVFYHTLPEDAASPANADTVWHAVSPDLRRWQIEGPALTSGPGWYDDVALWAPDVVFDPATERWAMLYTGVAAGMVQRACLAWSADLSTWTKSPANPVFEPDSLVYHWAPQQNWSSFRDPFVFHDGAQWVMLSTAGLRLGGYPGFRRGIVHRAVSSDLENWQDGGVFYEHDGTEGRTRDLESVQYLVRGGWHHLFFVEQNLAIENHPTSHLVAADPSGWTMAGRTDIDAGWAPEIKRFDATAGAAVFARLAKDQDPRDDSWFVTARFDSVRFDDGGRTPVVFMDVGPGAQWPGRTGSAGAAAPTFAENPVWRGEPGLGGEGHGSYSSRENYGGPLTRIGAPGLALGDSAVGDLISAPFVIAGDHLRLLLAGGDYPATCYLALIDNTTGVPLSYLYPTDPTTLVERLWDLGPLRGRTARLVIVDQETGPGGWIAVDGIEERDAGLSGVDPGAPRGLPVSGLTAWPNPFNPHTTIRFGIARAADCRAEVYDLAGRRVWRSGLVAARAGAQVQIAWDGRDRSGRPLPSGAYFARIVADGLPAAGLRLMLLK